LIEAENTAFNKAVEICQAAKQVLDGYKLKSFAKTSGKTGMHIYIPCSGIDFHQSRLVASMIADEIHELAPMISTRNETINQRGDNVYIDAGQNDYADTLAAAYCIRPYHEPLVSTPLDWKEVKTSLDRWSFNIESIGRRINRKGDIFAGVLDKKLATSNARILQKMLKGKAG
jgi:bifunctional non-homologous end joining protein LigD